MAQCEKTAGRSMKTLAEAQRLVRTHYVPVVPIRTVPLAAARNRVLATNLAAAIDLPPHDSAAMDGFAVRAADLSSGIPRLELIGRAAAGHPFNGTIAGGQAVRILTGAPLPDGADAVVMQETCVIQGNTVRIAGRVAPGANFRPRGEDVRAG